MNQINSDRNKLSQQEIEELSNKPERKRWLIQILLFFLSFSSGISLGVYSPIQNIAEKYFKVDTQTILWHNQLWQVSYLFLSLPALYTVMNWNIRTSMIIAGVTNSIGAWIRYIARRQFYFSLSGTFFLTLSQLWYSPGTAIIIDRFHPPSERVLVTSVLVFSNNLGISVGYIYSALYVGEDVNSMDGMQFYFAILNTFPIILILLFFDERPKYFKNKIEERPENEFFQSIIGIFTKGSNLFSLALLSIFVGVTWTYQTVVQNILQPMGYDVLTLGYFGLYMNVAGTIGGFASSLVMANQQEKGMVPKYDFFIKFFITLETLLCFLLNFLIYFYKNSLNTFVTYSITSLIGLGQNAFVPVGIQAFMDTAYPFSECSALNAFFLVSQIPNFAFVYISAKRPYILNYIMLPFYLTLMFCYKTKLERYKVEQSQKTNKDQQQLQQQQQGKYFELEQISENSQEYLFQNVKLHIADQNDKKK